MPTEVGWRRVSDTITFDDLDDIMDRIENATGVSTDFGAARKRRGVPQLAFRHSRTL